MKKRAIAAATVLALAFTLSLTGCQENSVSGSEAPSQSVESQEFDKFVEPHTPTADWGITLSAKDITETGLVLVITQSGGEPTGELEYGSDFHLEVLHDGVWEAVPYAIEGDLLWTSEGHFVLMNSAEEKELSLENIYGKLSPGTYRIGKEFIDFRGAGDYDTETYYAEFEIK